LGYRPLIRCSKRLAGLKLLLLCRRCRTDVCLSARLRPSSILREPNPISDLPLLRHQNMTPSSFTNRPDQPTSHASAHSTLLFLPQPPLPAPVPTTPPPPQIRKQRPRHPPNSQVPPTSLLAQPILPVYLSSPITILRPYLLTVPTHPTPKTLATPPQTATYTTRIKINHMPKSRKQHTRVFWIF
jgi:hypothetical protein